MRNRNEAHPSSIRRRTLLTATSAGIGLGMAGILASCTRSLHPVTTSKVTPSQSSTPSPTPVSEPATWDALATVLGPRLLRPGAANWTNSTQLENPRWDGANPRGIAIINGPDDAAACIRFARQTKTPIAVRAGGHSYTGWSAGGAPGTNVPASLVISTQNLATITLSSDKQHVTIGPGATLISVYRTLAAAGRAIGAGSCPTVGIGGLTLGGGIGVLSRNFGLTCDQLTSLEIVTADGTIRTASASENADLFWACQGGSGGIVGVVTALTFRTQPAPTITRFALAFPWSAAATVVQTWQQWAPQADKRLWSTLKLLNGTRYTEGPSVSITGTWTGPAEELDTQLEQMVSAAAPSGRQSTTADYGLTMDFFAGTTGIPTEACTTATGGRLQRVAEAATSHIGLRTIDAAAITTLLQQVEQARSVTGLRDGGVALDALGGAVSEIASNATAFPWRSALYDVQYTAVFDTGADPQPYDAYIRKFRQAMQPTWGDTGYSNYVDAAVTDPATYFGENIARLRSVSREHSADAVFSQPHWV